MLRAQLLFKAIYEPKDANWKAKTSLVVKAEFFYFFAPVCHQIQWFTVQFQVLYSLKQVCYSLCRDGLLAPSNIE